MGYEKVAIERNNTEGRKLPLLPSGPGGVHHETIANSSITESNIMSNLERCQFWHLAFFYNYLVHTVFSTCYNLFAS